MFGNVGERVERVDKRVVRTRDELGDALMVLMQEKAFEAITVQEVLDRAGVARSTFYKHYRDKEDLFLSDVEDFFTMLSTWLTRTGADTRRLAPVAEMFGHLRDVKGFYAALLAAGKAQDVIALGQGMFARTIADRLRGAGVVGDADALAAMGNGLAGSLFGMLEWWIAKGMKTPPAEMDAMWHGLAWGGVQSGNGR